MPCSPALFPARVRRSVSLSQTCLRGRVTNYPASKSILRGLCCSLLLFQVHVLPHVLGVQNSACPKVGSELKPKEDWWGVRADRPACLECPLPQRNHLIFKLEILKSVHRNTCCLPSTTSPFSELLAPTPAAAHGTSQPPPQARLTSLLSFLWPHSLSDTVPRIHFLSLLCAKSLAPLWSALASLPRIPGDRDPKNSHFRGRKGRLRTRTVGWGSPKVQFHDTRELSATGQTLPREAQKEPLCQGGGHHLWPGSVPYPYLPPMGL